MLTATVKYFKMHKIAGELANTDTVKEEDSRNLDCWLNWFPSFRLTFRRHVFNGVIKLAQWYFCIFRRFIFDTELQQSMDDNIIHMYIYLSRLIILKERKLCSSDVIIKMIRLFRCS
ncbi:unnamed protein product [Wuchereria bancrofti]|uniref:Uncharacterized protein n=1 Tax=Wuchereria bancrofti TaxID=6293 RepID=A0A3P7DZ20_WUCBA|nr:unnamed protein product [Wuchereria bancrofti]